MGSCEIRVHVLETTGPDDLEPSGLGFNPVPDWDGAMDQRALAAKLESAIAALPADQREAVILRHRLGLSQAEMAETLRVPEGTVKSRLSCALAALRGSLEGLDR